MINLGARQRQKGELTSRLETQQHARNAIIGHERFDRSVTLLAKHSALILDISETLLVQVVSHQVEAASPLADDDRLFGTLSAEEVHWDWCFRTLSWGWFALVCSNNSINIFILVDGRNLGMS